MRIVCACVTLAASMAWAQHPGATPPSAAARIGAQQFASQAMYTANRMSAQAQQNARNFQQMQYAAQNRQLRCAKAPTFSVESGSFSSPLSVEIADATSGAVIYYTLDGKKPTTASTRYAGPITITATT